MNRLKRTWPVLSLVCVVAGVSAAAWAVRTYLVEPESVAQSCAGNQAAVHAAAWQCAVREWSVAGFVHNGYGVAALVAGVMATILRWRALAVVAVVVGAIGAVLYRFELAGLGGLLGALVWIRGFGTAAATLQPPSGNE